VRRPLARPLSQVALPLVRLARPLGRVARLLGCVPLAWDQAPTSRTQAIEVYPAATLRAHGIQPGEYKGASEVHGRQGLLGLLGTRVTVQGDIQVLERSADALDAVVCLVAGADFLEGRAVPPTDVSRARKKGWIWARCRPMPSLSTRSTHHR